VPFGAACDDGCLLSGVKNRSPHKELMILSIQVSKIVMDGLRAVRTSDDDVNLYDIPIVVLWLEAHSYPEAASWLGCHEKDYRGGLVFGFEVEP
jgi:hypothetical protein